MWNERGSSIVLWCAHTPHDVDLCESIIIESIVFWGGRGDVGVAKTNIILLRGNSGFVRKSVLRCGDSCDSIRFCSHQTSYSICS